MNQDKPWLPEFEDECAFKPELWELPASPLLRTKHLGGGIPRGQLFLTSGSVGMHRATTRRPMSMFAFQEYMRYCLLDTHRGQNALMGAGRQMGKSGWNRFIINEANKLGILYYQGRPHRPEIKPLTFAIRQLTTEQIEPITIHASRETIAEVVPRLNPRYALYRARSVGKSIPMIFDSLAALQSARVQVLDADGGDSVPFELYREAAIVSVPNPKPNMRIEYSCTVSPAPTYNPPPKFTGLKRKK